MGSARQVLISALVIVAGCAPASPLGTAPSVVPAGSGAESADCPPIDLRSPSGNPLDLSGTWIGNDFGRFGLHQHGSCVQWVGRSQYRGEDLGESWTTVLTGTINPDFTISARWGDVPYYPDLPTEFFSAGSLDLAIEFGGSGPDEFPILKVVFATGGIGATRLVPETALRPPVTLDGTLGGNFDHLLQTGCIWIESGDQRYELFGDGGWSLRSDLNLRIEDDRGQVFAREGDPIRITGITSPGLASDCVENAILIQELDPSP